MKELSAKRAHYFSLRNETLFFIKNHNLLKHFYSTKFISSLQIWCLFKKKIAVENIPYIQYMKFPLPIAPDLCFTCTSLTGD